MIERIPIDEWREFDACHPAPTFFARPAWALALCDARPGSEPAPLRVRLGRQNIIVPLVKISGGALRWREYYGFPLGGYTCFMHEDGTLASAQECESTLALIFRDADSATIIPWPLGPVPSSCRAERFETAVVDLSQGIESALSSVAGIFRRMAGQAERRGVTCAPSNRIDAADAYYALLQKSARRWGIETPTIPKVLIESLVRRGGNDVEIWFARADGHDIAGGIVFYGSREMFFWSAAMDAAYARLRGSNALNFALLRAAAMRGMHWYNLGASEGLPGVAKFKEHLGARSIPYYGLHAQRAPFRVYSNVRRLLAAR